MEKISNSFEKKMKLLKKSFKERTRMRARKRPKTKGLLLMRMASMVKRNVPRRRRNHKQNHFLKEQQIIRSIDFSIG